MFKIFNCEIFDRLKIKLCKNVDSFSKERKLFFHTIARIRQANSADG